MKIEIKPFDELLGRRGFIVEHGESHVYAAAKQAYCLTLAAAEQAVSARTCATCGATEGLQVDEDQDYHCADANRVLRGIYIHKDAIMTCWHARAPKLKVPCICCKKVEATHWLFEPGTRYQPKLLDFVTHADPPEYCAACGKTHLAEAVAAWEAKQVKHPCPCCGKESTWFVQVAHGNEANAKRQGHRFSAERCSDMYTYQQENNKFNDSHLGCEKYATDNAARLNAEWRKKNGLCECGKPVTGHKRNTDNGRAFFGRRARGHEKSATWYKGDCCDTCGMAWLKEGREASK